MAVKMRKTWPLSTPALNRHLHGICDAAERIGQAIEVLLIRGTYPGLDRLRGLDVVEGLLPGQARPAVGSGKMNGEREIWKAIVSYDDKPGWIEYREVTLVSIGLPIRRVHCEYPLSAVFELEYLERVCKATWAPP